MMNQAISPIRSHEAIILGGLIFNHQPLKQLSYLFKQVRFIDINQFTYIEIEEQIAKLIYQSSACLILIGYSTGGLVALKIYTKFIKLIKKLIFINSTPFFIESENWHGISQKNYHRLWNKLNHLSLEQFKDHFCCLALFPDIPQSIERLRIQSKFCVKPNIEHWLKIILTTDLRQQLNQISIPTLFIYADKDSIVPSTNKFSHRLITQYTISESTHASFNILELVYQIGEFIDDKQ